MTGIRPIFVFGIARAGTNLVARMLDAHPAVEVVLDPLLPVFKTLRNANLERAGLRFDPGAPFQDGYGSAGTVAQLDAVLGATLDLPLPAADLAALRESFAARAALEAPDVAALAGRLDGATFKALFDSALDVMAAARGGAGTRWVGPKEVWTIDFVPALARAYPEARFVVIERDPRAVIASLAAMAAQDPTQHAHPLSYLRHWRKAVALARRFEGDPALNGRFRRVSYEGLTAEPEAHARALCDFLDLPFAPSMLRPGNSVDRATGEAWRGNSSHRADGAGITTESVERWRARLPAAVVRTVEFMAGPEMRLAGYALPDAAPSLDAAMLSYMLDCHKDPGSWRSDLAAPALDCGLELFRHRLLGLPADAVPADLIRPAFLFRAVFDAARGGAAAR